MFSLDDLKFFSVLARCGSLAQAARVLNVSAPAVTRRLQAMERRIGGRLVDRSTRVLSMTDDGLEVFHRGRNILLQVDQLAEAVATRSGGLAGRLRVTAPFGFGRLYVAPLVGEFCRSHPDVQVDLQFSDVPMQRSSDGWDIAIHIGELKSSTLVMSRLAPNERWLCASPAFLARYGEPSHPDALRQLPCVVVRENDEDVTLWRLSHRGRPLSVRVNAVMTSNDGEVARAWAVAGFGILQRSAWSVAGDVRQGRLLRVLPEWQVPRADVVALTPVRVSRMSRVRAFLDLLRERLRAQPWHTALDDTDDPQ